MDDIFKWVMGGLVTAFGGVSTWLLMKYHSLDKAVAVLIDRPYVDPIEYAKAASSLAGAITLLTSQLVTLDKHRVEQMKELTKDFEDLRLEVRLLRKALEDKQHVSAR